MTGSGSSRLWGESSSCHSPESTPTPTTMDYEQDKQEEQFEEVQAEPQAEAMEIDEDNMLVNDKATPLSRTEASSTPKPSIRNSSSKQVCTKT